MSTTLTERQLGRAVEQNKKYIYLQNETASDGSAGLHREPGGGHTGRRTILCVLGRHPAVVQPTVGRFSLGEARRLGGPNGVKVSGLWCGAAPAASRDGSQMTRGINRRRNPPPVTGRPTRKHISKYTPDPRETRGYPRRAD